MTKDILEVAEKDYKFVLQAIAYQEIDNQIRIGNKPSNIIVDGSGNKPITDAAKSIVVYFTDAKSMIKAIQAAHDELRLTGRSVSGNTLENLTYYAAQGRGQPTAGLPVASAVNAGTALYITIPVAWVRHWQFMNAKGTPTTRRSRAKINKGKKVMVAESIFDRAARKVQKQFPYLRVYFTFIEVANVNPSGRPVTRIPAVCVRQKRKGLLQ